MNKINIHFNQVSEGLTLINREQIAKVIEVLRMVKKRGNQVFVCGNGGSHATATHFVNDLVKMCRMKASSVGSEVPTMLAYGNDEGWDNMFSEPIRAKFEDGDCVFGISCSGNSENVIKALGIGQKYGGFAVGLTGLSKKNKMEEMALDGLVYVPVPDIRPQEDLHMVICHAIVRALQDGG